MTGRVGGRFAPFLVLAGFAVLTALPMQAQTVELRRVGDPGPTPIQSEELDFVFCIDAVLGFVLNVFSGPPSSTVTFDVTQSVSGVLGFSLAQAGPWANALMVDVATDAAGNGTSAPFYVLGQMAGQTILNACSPQVGCVINPQEIAVVEIASAEWEAVDSPLDANPNTGGGQRLFPGKETASDTTDRKKVRAKATLNPPVADIPLQFRSFDVDDPSTDASPVDPNADVGDDNRGAPMAGTLSATSATTDAAGEASVDLTVTLQPGDNFRIAAACDPGYLAGVTVNVTDLEDADGNTLPTPQAQATEMLTVWRRVHVELDSMGLVNGNQVTGTVVATRPNTSRNRTRIDLGVGLENARFENGVLSIDGVGSFPVLSNNPGSVNVQGIVASTAAVGQDFVLVDDDDFNNDDGTNLDGDETENVTGPDTSLISDSDNASANVFAPAYVRPVYDVGDGNDFVPFLLNEVGSDSASLIATYDFDSIGTEADEEFWTVYLLGAYQHTTNVDADPGREGAVLGIVDDINGVGANVFNEVLRSAEINITSVVNNAATTAHEIGHLFSGIHRHGGLMAQSRTRSVNTFSDDTLATIRSLDHP